jgi:hypothetical protein
MTSTSKTISFGDGRKFKMLNDNQAVAEFPSGHRVLFYKNSNEEDNLEYGSEWTSKELSDWYSSIDEAMQGYRDEFPHLTETKKGS